MRLLTAALLIAALAGCAAKPVPERVSERVILLPSESGAPSGVVVRTRDTETLLSSPYAAVEIRGAKITSAGSTAEEVEQRYGGLQAAQPYAPEFFVMFFVLGTDEFTPGSKIEFEEARKKIAAWPAAEVVVIGHTDRLGSVTYNDGLSRRRAEMVASRLVAAGVARERIQVAARGEREPLVPTPDNVAEPRNRRVEIKVR